MHIHSILRCFDMANKRDQILRSAEKIIALERVQNLSMQKLADDAEVAAGTIYRYFKSKDELISIKN